MGKMLGDGRWGGKVLRSKVLKSKEVEGRVSVENG
jgi:hypothetical protein